MYSDDYMLPEGSVHQTFYDHFGPGQQLEGSAWLMAHEDDYFGDGPSNFVMFAKYFDDSWNWKGMHIRIFTDGGKRRKKGEEISGIGWIALGQKGKKTIRLLEGGGWLTQGNDKIDSVATEIIAIEAATKLIDEFMNLDKQTEK